MIYVVMVESLLSGNVKVSQEGYSTLEAAQRFCESRSNDIRRVSRYEYKDRNYIYTISSVSVKK